MDWVVACASSCDRKGYLRGLGCGLLRNTFVTWMWPAKEYLRGLGCGLKTGVYDIMAVMAIGAPPIYIYHYVMSSLSPLIFYYIITSYYC